MMKVTLQISSVLFALVFWSATAWAQPANDHCSGAIPLIVYDSEDVAIPVGGDTRNTTDGALDNIPVCSANFYRDDVWYTVTAPDTVVTSGYAFRVYVDEFPTDMDSFGIAVYSSCDAVAGNTPLFCGNSPAGDQGVACLDPGQTVYIRVWSAHGDATVWQTGWGTFRIAVFPVSFGESEDAVVLWGNETGQGDFAGGLNGWTAEGISCNGTGPENALWAWTSTGYPSYIFGGESIAAIKSRTFCNGSVIFDSALLHYGETGVAGSGPCPWDDHEGALVSPTIDISAFNVRGVSLLFNQSMQRFINGLHFIDYSTDGGATWDTIQINNDKTYLSTNPSTGGGFFNEEMRVRLPGAEGSSNLIVKFRFQGGAYWWVIDDVRIIETECNSLRINTKGDRSFYAIAPWAQIPENQVREWAALADIENIGACPQTHVVLNFKVENRVTGEVVYNQNLTYGTIAADSVAENKLFPELVDLPKEVASYRGTYTLTSDSTDFNPSDNTISFDFEVGGTVFAHETGATRSISVNPAIYSTGAPQSWAYGNIFRPEVDANVDHIVWGVNNADTMVAYGKTVTLLLIQWTDTNGDKIAEANERRIVGIAEHVFQGVQPVDGLFSTVLENFEDPSDPVVMKAGFQYIMMVEYVNRTVGGVSEPQIELLASDERDYDASILAMDSAYVHGLTDERLYMTALGFSADGNIANIDYEVTEIDVNDQRRTFGDDIVPVIRIHTTPSVNTDDELPVDNTITVYPNPTSDNLSVKLEFVNPYERVQLRLINNIGQTVHESVINSQISNYVHTIRVSDLSAGNYMLQVETVDGQRSIPVVIMK